MLYGFNVISDLNRRCDVRCDWLFGSRWYRSIDKWNQYWFLKEWDRILKGIVSRIRKHHQVIRLLLSIEEINQCIFVLFRRMANVFMWCVFYTWVKRVTFLKCIIDTFNAQFTLRSMYKLIWVSLLFNIEPMWTRAKYKERKQVALI